MEELLKKINGNLIEIKTKLDKNSFHISGGSNNIGQQNITYSTFNKPLESYQEKIQTRLVFHTSKDKIILSLFFILPIFIIAFIIYKNDIFYSFIFTFFILIYFIVLIYFSIKKWKRNLIIENDKLVLEQANGIKKEDIYFKDIRSFLKQKSIFGYQFFIYEKTKIEPKFGFTFFSIHKAIAIEELLKSKINKAINEKQNS